MLTADFLPQAMILALLGLGCLAVGLRTLRTDKHHYALVRRKTGGARRAAVGTVGHQVRDQGDAMVVHGMAIARRNGRRVIVRNGKIARDSIAAC